MSQAIGILELTSIAKGMEAGDAMLKSANVNLLVKIAWISVRLSGLLKHGAWRPVSVPRIAQLKLPMSHWFACTWHLVLAASATWLSLAMYPM